MKTVKEFKTRKEAIANGYNYAGHTTDFTMRGEIARDLKASGASVAFVTEGFKLTFWTKREQPEQLGAWLHGWKA